MESSHHGSTRPDRKTIEKNRRIHMKALCSKLDSILPHSPHAREGMTVPLPDRIDEAISYIKQLRERIDRMKERKRQLQGISTVEGDQAAFGGINRSPPKIQVHGLSSGGENVIVMTGAGDRSAFYDVVEALEEEGVHVLSATSAVDGCRAFHTIHTMGTGARRLEAYELSEMLMNKIRQPT